MATQRNAVPVFVDGEPPQLDRQSHSPYDAFRDALQSRPGVWASLGTFDDRGSAQSRASVIRNGRGRWANATYEAMLSPERVADQDTGQLVDTGNIAVLVRYMGPARPKAETSAENTENGATGESEASVDTSAEVDPYADEVDAFANS